MSIRRRDFLKAAPVAASAAALAATVRNGDADTLQTRAVRIGSEPYKPVRDYPIRAVRYSDVVLTDTFWKPKVDRNASVTIPFEVDKRGAGGRGFGGNLLEAAILLLKTHPDPALQARVDARIQALKQSPGAGNGGFEVAAAWFHATGDRDLIDHAIKAADALYQDFKDGDVIEVSFPVEPRQAVAHSRVRDTRGRVAIERGPIVYCAESPDLDGNNAMELLIDPTKGLSTIERPDLPGGVTAIRVEGRSVALPASHAGSKTLIPYHLWANRGAATMSVWLSTREYAPGDVGPAGGFIFYVNPNFTADGWRYLEAAPYDQSAGAKWGCFRQAIPGARGMAVGTGPQNTKDMLAACAEPGTAAQLCATLDVNGIRGWFLPSRDELALMYKNLKAAGVSDFGTRGISDNFSYWTSSQQTADMAQSHRLRRPRPPALRRQGLSATRPRDPDDLIVCAVGRPAAALRAGSHSGARAIFQ